METKSGNDGNDGDDDGDSSSSFTTANVKMPAPPYIAAGALGGPCVIYAVTPLRNALTLGALNQKATAVELYRQVWRTGLFGGGAPMAVAAVPGFLVLGPAFHVFYDAVGGSAAAAVGLTALSESLIFYGAETRNAMVAFAQNQTNSGTTTSGTSAGTAASGNTKATAAAPSSTCPVKPPGMWGPGFALHVSRNVLAMSGLRVFSRPTQAALQDAIADDTTRVVVADLCANLVVSAASAPLHQLYGWTVTARAAAAATTPQAAATAAASTSSFTAQAIRFLQSQYLTADGRRLSRVAGRDMVLRCVYNATIFTLYGAIERGLVRAWPTTWYWW